MTSEAGAPQRAEQVAQRLIPQKVEALIGNFKAHLGLAVAHLSGGIRLARAIMGLVDGNEILLLHAHAPVECPRTGDRKSTRLNSSHQIISYAVFCLKKKKKNDSQ